MSKIVLDNLIIPCEADQIAGLIMQGSILL
jgi:hypothetical protein